MSYFDSFIIGSGPAGCTSSIYLSMGQKKHCLITGNYIGGIIVTTEWVENFPGLGKVTGPEMAQKMMDHCCSFPECNLIYGTVTKIIKKNDLFEIYVGEDIYYSKTIIFATGSSPRKLPLQDIKGVVYCSTCDGYFYRNKEVAVVGGGNSSFEAILYLAPMVKKVYLIHRSENFRAFDNLISKVKVLPNVEWVLNYTIESYEKENDTMIGLFLKGENKIRNIKCDGLFVCIGHTPNTNLIKDLVILDNEGYVVCNANMETSLEGFFVCGDVISENHWKQAVIASSQGCISALACIRFLNNK